MPEIITKYPDIVLQILRESGAKCGEGAIQRILTACPQERFCSLPTGELCVYGLNEISKMTQINIGEITQVISTTPLISSKLILLLALTFVAGLAIGILFYKKIIKRKPS